MRLAADGMLDDSNRDEWEADRRRAVLEVQKELRKHVGRAVSRLNLSDLQSAYPNRDFVDGWRIPILFSDEKERYIDILITKYFPVAAARSALVDRPEFLTWPHIEHDGILCLLQNSSEVDPDAPVEVMLNILHRSAKLVEELIEGSIVDRDFKEEFLTYWFYAATSNVKNTVTLFEPRPPSRILCTWVNDHKTYVAESADELVDWVKNSFGQKLSDKARKNSQPAAFLWLCEPLLPSQFPETGEDIWALAQNAGPAEKELLLKIAQGGDTKPLFMLGANGRGGAGLMPITIDRNTIRPGESIRIKDRMNAGHRKGKTGLAVLASKTFGKTPTSRTQVLRADAQWIHGRGKDQRSSRLLNSSIVIFGCGSVGSFIAENMARAGVGTIHIVDYDDLIWANVGRHVLGASSVGKNKALELAAKLQREFPHLKIVGHDSSVRTVTEFHYEILTDSDLIVSATGNWAADSHLNKWHQHTKRVQPIIYGWTEDYALSGSAVVIGAQGSCLACGLNRTGSPQFIATSWPGGRDINSEPACSDHYQPYGAIELAFVNTMISNVVLEELLTPSNQSHRKVWLSSTDRLTQAGGEWSAALAILTGENFQGDQMLEIGWSHGYCNICKGQNR